MAVERPTFSNRIITLRAIVGGNVARRNPVERA
jgi:hypothetical protein